jgi:ketosteroid isomerase-like protein
MSSIDQQRQMTWYEEVYACVDGRDDSVVDRLFTEDVSLRFNFNPPVEGREAVRQAMHHFWGSVAAMRHSFVNVVEDGDRSALEAVVTYTRHDGVEVSLPVVTMTDRRDGLVCAQRIYIDMAPLADPALLETQETA